MSVRMTDERLAEVESLLRETNRCGWEVQDLLAEVRRAREAEVRDFRPDVVFARGYRQGASEEREACAALLDDEAAWYRKDRAMDSVVRAALAKECSELAAAIRGRGKEEPR